MNAIHYTFVADTSSTSTRSFYMGLVWVVDWVGTSLSVGISPVIDVTLSTRFNLCFATAVIWVLYLGYVAFVLPETLSLAVNKQRPVDSATNNGVPMSLNMAAKLRSLDILYAIWEPLPLLFGHPILRWLGAVSFTAALALEALSFLSAYCFSRFGPDPLEVCLFRVQVVSTYDLCLRAQAGLVTAAMTISKTVSVLCILPLFVAIYRWSIYRSKDTEQLVVQRRDSEHATERTPLLAGDSQPIIAVAGHVGDNECTASAELSAAQELVVCRIGFLLHAVGMLLAWRSENAIEVAMCTYLGILHMPNVLY